MKRDTLKAFFFYFIVSYRNGFFLKKIVYWKCVNCVQLLTA
jgi:hypothetical protein